MAATDEGLSRQDRFEKYNPYGSLASDQVGHDDHAAAIYADLAIAFEVAQLRTEIHFQGKRS